MNRDDIIRMAQEAGISTGGHPMNPWNVYPSDLERFAALVAAALKMHEQEPVAWMVYTLDGKSVCVTDNPSDFTDVHPALPLFTSPNLRKPLTDEEIDEMIAKAVAAEREACAKAAENQWETLGTQRRTAERCAAAIRARGEE